MAVRRSSNAMTPAVPVEKSCKLPGDARWPAVDETYRHSAYTSSPRDGARGWTTSPTGTLGLYPAPLPRVLF